MPTESLITSPSGEWEIVFSRIGDRYAHRILWRPAPDAEPWILSSLEGADTDAWPPSPPLQQLSIESHGGPPIAFLLGMAGSSHWSASIEVDDQGLLFDIACRHRDAGRLASEYTLQPAASSERPCVQPAADSSCNIEWTADQLTIRPAESKQTTRWRYRICRG